MGQAFPASHLIGSREGLEVALVATGRITGEEDRHSHPDLGDFAATLEGSQVAVQALRRYPRETRPALVTEIDERFARTGDELGQDRAGDGWTLHDQLTREQPEGLGDSITALTGAVSQVAAVVADR